MSLLKAAQQAADNDVDTAVAAPAEQAPVTQADPAQVAQAALVAHQAKAALAVAKPKANPMVVQQMKDALRVSFDTLAALKANQGKFFVVESEQAIGEWVDLQLMSWQDSWVASPNNMTAPKELVKYSQDGKTADDGTDLVKHIEDLKAQGYDKAKISHRCVLVGALLAAEKPANAPLGTLVQIDMSPKSKSMFERYQANAAWNLTQGKLTEDEVKTVRLTANTAKGPDNTTYTKIDFQAVKLVG